MHCSKRRLEHSANSGGARNTGHMLPNHTIYKCDCDEMLQNDVYCAAPQCFPCIAPAVPIDHCGIIDQMCAVPLKLNRAAYRTRGRNVPSVFRGLRVKQGPLSVVPIHVCPCIFVVGPGGQCYSPCLRHVVAALVQPQETHLPRRARAFFRRRGSRASCTDLGCWHNA